MGEIIRNPTSDSGQNGTWTRSSGTNAYYTYLDDYATDTSGTDYLDVSTTGGWIEFGFSALDVPTGATDIVVYVEARVTDPTAGNNRIATRIYSNTTVANGTNYATGTVHPTYYALSQSWTTDPSTSAAWTVSGINSNLTRFGLYSSDAAPAVRCCAIQLRVTYTDPSTPVNVSTAESQAVHQTTVPTLRTTASAVTPAAQVLSVATLPTIAADGNVTTGPSMASQSGVVPTVAGEVAVTTPTAGATLETVVPTVEAETASTPVEVVVGLTASVVDSPLPSVLSSAAVQALRARATLVSPIARLLTIRVAQVDAVLRVTLEGA